MKSIRLPKYVIRVGVVVSALVASVALTAQPASAAYTSACKGNPFYSGGDGQVCVGVWHSGTYVTKAMGELYFVMNTICNYRSYHSAVLPTGWWATISDYHYQCVWEVARVYTNVYLRFMDPTWFYAKMERNGRWLSPRPGVLIQS